MLEEVTQEVMELNDVRLVDEGNNDESGDDGVGILQYGESG